MAKKETNKDNPLVIPFGKAVRVGNFKLWRGNYVIGRGKDRTGIECVHVSSLDGSWMVRIPSTSQMFSTIANSYATTDETIRDNFLGMLFSNFMNVTNVPSEALHDAFFFLTEMMTYPYLLLSEDEMVKRMSDGLYKYGMPDDSAKAHIEKMVEKRRGLYELIEKKKILYIEDYERQLAERRAKAPDEEKQMDDDEMADKAFDILTKGKGGN